MTDEVRGIKLVFTHCDGSRVEMSHPDADMNWEDFCTHLRAFSVACGFSIESIEEIFG